MAGIRSKVVLLGPGSWALASINFFAKKALSEFYDVSIVSWSDLNWRERLNQINADVIISEASILKSVSPQHDASFFSSIIPVWHAWAKIPGVEHGLYTFDLKENVQAASTLGAITREIQDSISDVYGAQSFLMPVGVDCEFWTKRSVSKINKITAVFSSNSMGMAQYQFVKNPALYDSIREEWGGESSISDGKSYLCGTYIYDGDAVICTSRNEGNPMALMECAAARIPFISTRCGLTREYDCVKTFETVEEAVDILNDLNSDPKKISDYCDQMYEEVALDRDWSKIIPEYWVTAIEEKLNMVHGDC